MHHILVKYSILYKRDIDVPDLGAPVSGSFWRTRKLPEAARM